MEITGNTIVVNGHHLAEIDRASAFPLPGSLCWQTFAEGTTASIEVRKVAGEKREPATYHLFYLAFAPRPSGIAVYSTPADAYRVSVELGGTFPKERGPRGD